MFSLYSQAITGTHTSTFISILKTDAARSCETSGTQPAVTRCKNSKTVSALIGVCMEFLLH